MTDIVFKEHQKIDNLWPLLIIAITLIFNWLLYFFYPNEDLYTFYSSMTVSLLVAAFLSLVKLETEITKKEIRYKLFPINFKWKVINKKDVDQSTVISVKPIKDYGGWGYRRGLKSKAYLVKGSDGLRLDLKDGQHIFVGTQRREELDRILKSW